MTSSCALKELAKSIADWLSPAPDMKIYVYGSRVRGDHRPGSDVDIHLVMPKMPTREFTIWWTEQNIEDFASLRAILPGRLEFLERDDPLGKDIENGEIVHQDRNVYCVWRKPQSKT
jgi:predicted nucleotidyltransferase